MRLLKHVSEKSEINMMTPSNLGIVFGPTLLRSDANDLKAMLESEFQCKVVETLVTYFTTIFHDLDDGEESDEDEQPIPLNSLRDYSETPSETPFETPSETPSIITETLHTETSHILTETPYETLSETPSATSIEMHETSEEITFETPAEISTETPSETEISPMDLTHSSSERKDDSPREEEINNNYHSEDDEGQVEDNQNEMK